MRTHPGSPPGSHAHLSFRKLSIIQSGSIFINQVKHNKKKNATESESRAKLYKHRNARTTHTNTNILTHMHTHRCWKNKQDSARVGRTDGETKCLVPHSTEDQTKCIFNFTRVFSIHRQKCLRISQKTC